MALDGSISTSRPGEILGIAGPNGAGKSTLVRIIAGEERPTLGELDLRRRSPGRPPTTGTAVAVVHQEPQLFPNLTVAENVDGRARGHGSRPADASAPPTPR